MAAATVGLITRKSQAAPPPPNLQRLGGFLSWVVTGFLGAGALVTLESIGLLLLPFAALAAFLTTRRFSFSSNSIGLIAGFGLDAIAIGLRNLGSRPCPTRPFLLAPGQLGAIECGGADPTPWPLTGLACVAFSVVTWLWLRRDMRAAAGS